VSLLMHTTDNGASAEGGGVAGNGRNQALATRMRPQELVEQVWHNCSACLTPRLYNSVQRKYRHFCTLKTASTFFVVNRFFVKMFKANNMEIVRTCQEHFRFRLLSDPVASRSEKLLVSGEFVRL